MAVITAAEISRHTAVFAHDSMRYGAARGDSLEQVRAQRQVQARVARYVAAQFRQFGLLPYPNPTSDGVQSYRHPGQLRLDFARSSIQMMAMLQHSGRMVMEELGNDLYRTTQLDFDTAAFLLPEAGPPMLGQGSPMGSARVTVLAGPQPANTLGAADLRDRVVVYVPPTGLDSASRRTVLARLYEESRGVVLVSDEDSVTFARHAKRARAEPVHLVERYLWEVVTPDARGRWALAVRPAAVQGLFRTANLDIAALQTATVPLRQELPAPQFWLWLTPEDSLSPSNVKAALPAVPYAEAVLEGTDSILKQQYVVVVANLSSGDDGQEMAGLLALARAFSQPGARPRRSVLFVATMDPSPVVTSSWFVASAQPPAGRMMAALTLERLHTAADTVVIDGGREVTLTAPPAVLAATHPELDLTVVDTGTTFRRGAMAYPFARGLIPSLALYAGGPGSPAGSTTPSASADKGESAVRPLRFAFYLANELATMPATPRWTAVGRERYAAGPVPDP